MPQARPKLRLVKWNRSEDGYCESKCGRFWITPSWNSCVNPQDFDLAFKLTPRHKWKKIRRMENTQRDCKEAAEWHIRQTLFPDHLIWVMVVNEAEITKADYDWLDSVESRIHDLDLTWEEYYRLYDTIEKIKE